MKKSVIKNQLQAVFILSSMCLTACSTAMYSDEEMAAESKKANAFFEKNFNEGVDRSPTYQTILGIKKDYDKWDDDSDAYAKKILEIVKRDVKQLKNDINYAALNKQEKISYDLFVKSSERYINNFKYRFHNYPINQMFGAQSTTPTFMINNHRISSVSDAEAYIARLQGIKDKFSQLIVNLKIREEMGIIPPSFVFPHVIRDAKNIIASTAFKDDFSKKTAALDLVDKETSRLIAEANTAIDNYVRPAYEILVAYLEQLEAKADDRAGVWKFPDGDEFYNARLKNITTTNLTAEDIHKTGLREVARIHNEMRDIMQRVGFKGDLQAFFEFMRTDPQFYYSDDAAGREQYLADVKSAIQTMRPRLSEVFTVEPKADLIVKRVEAFREKSAGKAFYNRPAPDGSRPGMYYVNLYDMKEMPRYQMEALTYHEAVPGHHMQLAIAQELEGIPKFRKYGGYTAYTEGWGLYSEFLPKEMGLYKDPYSDFGRLAMELWRACRLVVDTGIHYKRWTRQQGIEYYKQNTPNPEKDVVKMVERHIVMPGQATAYKVGMLKILALRKYAKTELGDRFDIREFHDVVIKNGALPLDVLESEVHHWVATKHG